MKPVTWGTAGHIDHGKTALIEALTGTNTDRLQEEQRRGVTIDIGFAFLSDSISFIDVPGHEKFVKNMVTGVSTIDAGLLVVAADDGVMPQTREHLDILRLLEISAGCIALTKIDLVDEDWLDLVEETVRETVEGAFLESAPIIRCSANTKEGVDELRQTIEEISSTIPHRLDRGISRLPVDRVFSVKGFGTVVTGTILSGQFNSGDSVEILPSRKNIKIRGIQTHGHTIESVGISERAALNLSNIGVDEIDRGDQVTTTGMLSVTEEVYASVRMLPNIDQPLKNNQRVRIHLGTTELLARCTILGNNRISVGSDGYIKLRFEEPAIVGFADRYIMRFYSPMHTIGGGKVLYSGALTDYDKAEIVEFLQRLGSDELPEVIETISKIQSPALLSLDDFVRILFFSKELLREPITSLEENEILYQVNSEGEEKYIITEEWNDLVEKFVSALTVFHSQNPKEPGITRKQLHQRLNIPGETFGVFLEHLVAANKIVEDASLLRLPDHSIRLTDEEKKQKKTLEETILKARFEPPSLNDLENELDLSRQSLQAYLKILLYENSVVRAGGELYLHHAVRDELQQLLKEHFESSDTLSVGDFKSLTGSSRKYVIPLLGYSDQQGWTIREGEVRIKHNL